MTIIASISKIGNIKSSSSSSIGSGRNSAISFGSNKIACGECGGSSNPMGSLIGNVANTGAGKVSHIPVTVMVDASVAMNPSSMLPSGGSCGCN
ncbi:coiled-coil family protein [Dictyostelium discoideum AX4]|uniref:HssA/B-like protein 23 n=1 Tax=Dictyostelium discoideum TaxID=44689 RepID=HSL23_DICDI|nr:coiled-coil family protein [Dictyostelium discoideum AX4]Q86H94.1 RecName: Full=HssA/B-like protein 23 [Dictyostelium discoideum]EAL69540.1 coiled-coil family protein [Dictyostelium discoideum AX4]|eukprot:XP_643410.1 coiled-coil family protein [Dictyostelium discoideum AX4]